MRDNGYDHTIIAAALLGGIFEAQRSQNDLIDPYQRTTVVILISRFTDQENLFRECKKDSNEYYKKIPASETN